MPEVGFEPTHPKIIELKSTALDHSAIQAYDTYDTRQQRDSNPRGQSPSDFESDALTTRPCCLMLSLSFGHTMVETPDPIRTLQLSIIGLA